MENLNAFRSAFMEAVAEQMSDDVAEAEIDFDAEAPLGQLDLSGMSQDGLLAPFGSGQDRPPVLPVGRHMA